MIERFLGSSSGVEHSQGGGGLGTTRYFPETEIRRRNLGGALNSG